MSPKKLTEDDKTEILKLYRDTSATTSTLADQFGVSSSTISRYLKNSLTETEYEDLIQQKRLARTPRSGKKEDEDQFEQKQTSLEFYLMSTVKEAPPEPSPLPIVDTIKKEDVQTAQAIEKEVIEEVIEEEKAEDKPRPVLRKKAEPQPEMPDFEEEEGELDEDEDEDEDEDLDMTSVGEMIGEDIDEDDDWDDDEDDEDELDEDYEEEIRTRTTELQILPLADAKFPSTCYLVIDRTAELITCPLREFAHLGKIPQEEVYQRTLPIFDNHRIARRFSKRSQRVIKVPDGKIFQKTYPYLADKGITRLLLDGQIYALPKQ